MTGVEETNAGRPRRAAALPRARLPLALLVSAALCGLPGCGGAPTAGPGPAPPNELLLDLGMGAAMRFAYIPPGGFLMGSPPGEDGRSQDERQHPVKITNGFYLGVTEVTQAQWRAVTGANPSYLWGDGRPVEHLSWDDAAEFCRKLSEKTGARCRLPTEAEWEYACRAGSAGAFCFGNDEAALDSYAWYQGNSSERKTHPVGEKQPNAWGLYDVHGNVREWCADWYGPYPAGAAADPTGARKGNRRVFRGGSWGSVAALCRCARRDGYEPGYREAYVGLRVAVDPAPSASGDGR